MAKRKIYDEHRTFQGKWTEEFAFVERAGSAVCLICNYKIASMKRFNVKRHFDTRHASFASKYPAGDSRKKVCQRLLSRVQANQQPLCVWTQQDLPMMTSCKRDKGEEKYCRDWEKETDLKDWVRPVVGDERLAACRVCESEMKANYDVLQQHMVTTKHQTCATPGCATALDNVGLSISKNSSNTLMETEGLCSATGSQKIKEEETDKASLHNRLGNATESFQFSAEPTLEDIRRLQVAFTAERGWGKYHQPRNLLLALVGEVGELAELFQWRDDAPEGLPGWTSSEREALSDELSDVLIYLVALANKCHVDLPTAALQKIEKNRLKYPVEQVYGSSKKYTEYQKE